ncbi:MAG: polysaccharide biosynthesis tyrosine autokinase [Acidobacteria bacterium]|nr:polysaccharide biosynthesis tyrosine autokinase [Acidobacteriota bacterium]
MADTDPRPILPSTGGASITPVPGQVTRVYPTAFPPPREEEVVEREIHLLDYWRVIRKRKWIVLGVLLAVGAVTTVRMYRAPLVYEATSRILINEQGPLRLSNDREPQQVVLSNDAQYLETQLNVLRSRVLAKRVIDRMALGRHREFADLARSQAEPAMRDRMMVDRLLGGLSVDLTRNARIVNVTYASPDPRLAADIANTISDEYGKYTLDMRANATRQSTDWLNRQVLDLREKARNLQDELLTYTRENQIVQLGENQTITVERLADLSKRVSEAEAESIRAALNYNLSRDPATNVDAIEPILTDPAIQTLNSNAASLRQTLAQLSATYTPASPKVVQVQEQLSEVEKQIAAQKQRILANIETAYRSAVAHERELRRELEKARGETLQQNERSIELGLKQREVHAAGQLYGDLLSKAQDVSLLSTLTTTNIQLLDQAEIPLQPARPNKKLNIVLSLIIGVALGVALAFFIEYLDNTVKSTEDVDRLLGLASLGVVPALDTLDRKGRLSLPAVSGKQKEGPRPLLTQEENSKSSFGEAYRSLRTSILLSSPEHPPRSMLFTSTRPGEGKTTTAINTAVSLTQTGARVIIVDGDLRKPGLHKALGIKGSPGLSAYLTSPTELASIIDAHATPNLAVIPSGAIPPNPSELLSSSKMRQAIRELSEQYDYVVIDSPPISTSDALILSTMVDGVIMVIRCGETPKELVVRAKRALEDVNARVFGVVLNRVDINQDGYYSYYYRYQYYADDQPGGQPH